MSMGIALAVGMLSLCCSLNNLSPDLSRTSAGISKRSVLVVSNKKEKNHYGKINEINGYCNGIIIETNLVLTARHCVASEMRVDGRSVRVLKVGTGLLEDLALLEVKTAHFPRLEMRSPSFENIFEFAYGRGNSLGVQLRQSSGRAWPLPGDFFIATVKCHKGHSGSGIFGKDGKLLGIITGGITLRGNTAISARKIKDFLGSKHQKIGRLTPDFQLSIIKLHA